jgi:hypothetical protein
MHEAVKAIRIIARNILMIGFNLKRKMSFLSECMVRKYARGLFVTRLVVKRLMCAVRMIVNS